MDNKKYRSEVIKICNILLSEKIKSGTVTQQDISEEFDKAMLLNQKWTSVSKQDVISELIRRYSISSGSYKKIKNDIDHEPWYSKERKIDRPYWQRYIDYLEREGLPPSTLDSIDSTTDSILSDMEDPNRVGLWDRRGLIHGSVQSGKTSNYTGLICKAADAGYKIIIVLAGLHNNLRSQTQIRLDEGFLGYNTEPMSKSNTNNNFKIIGVGEINNDPKLRPQWVTNRLENGDFKEIVAKNFGVTPEDRPWLFVVKKNKSVLENLLRWLRDHVAHDIDKNSGKKKISHLSLLMIDDEADNASVDTGDQDFSIDGKPNLEHEPKTINRLIRRLLLLFDKKAYVGYTATPFANIFIHEKGDTYNEGADLFPSSFIYNLPVPSNYIGAEHIFSNNTCRNEKSSVIFVDDHNTNEGKEGWIPEKHNKYHVPSYSNEENMPPSLMSAIYCFIIACSIKNCRGLAGGHSSMLIHVSRFQDVQNLILDTVSFQIRTFVQRINRGLSTEIIYRRLEDTWRNEFYTKESTDVWNDIKIEIPKVICDIEIKVINGSAKDALDYKNALDPKRLIVIGGDKLARGLTLDGLVTSYFLRTTKMYDSLLQMGRWFGYRDGYSDLCRVFTTVDLVEWFDHISNASQELRDEFDYMSQRGMTPKDYGLKVKSHPTLLVTSPLKMRSGEEVLISFSGEGAETINFDTDINVVKKNYKIFEEFCDVINNRITPSVRDGVVCKGSTLLWKNILSQDIINFLSAYQVSKKSLKFNTNLMSEFIEKMNDIGELIYWNVAVISGSSNKKLNILGGEISQVIRTSRDIYEGSYSIGRLISPKDLLIDLSSCERGYVEEYISEEMENEPSFALKTRLAKTKFNAKQAKGLLLIYPIDSIECNYNIDHPLIGCGISFPSSSSGKKVKYIINSVGQKIYE